MADSEVQAQSTEEQRLLEVGKAASRERVDALNDLAYSLTGAEEWDRMQTLGQESAELARSLGYGHGEGRALGIIAFVRYIRSDLKAALADCMEGIRLAQGDNSGEARIRVVLGMVHWTLGNTIQRAYCFR